MSNLKVGMRVKAVTDYPENSNKRISIGDVGTLTNIEGDYVYVNFDGKVPEVIFSWRVEPVTEEPKQMKPTDKITVEITLAELAKIYALTSKASGSPSILYAMARDMIDPENKRLQFMRGMTHKDVFDYYDYEHNFINLLFPKKSPTTN